MDRSGRAGPEEDRDLSGVRWNTEVEASERLFDIGDDFLVIPLIIAPSKEDSTIGGRTDVQGTISSTSPPHYFGSLY